MPINKEEFYDLVIRGLQLNFQEDNSLCSKVIGLLQDDILDRFHIMQYEENMPADPEDMVMTLEDYEYLVSGYLASLDDDVNIPRHIVIVELMRSARGDRDILGLMWLTLEPDPEVDKVEYFHVKYGIVEVNGQGEVMETPGDLVPLGSHPFF